MDEELQIAIELDYRRVLIVPLSELGDVLRLLVARQYKQDGYGKDATYQRIALGNDLPAIRIVPQHALVTARLLGDIAE